MAGSTPIVVPSARLYSLVVAGWERARDGEPDAHVGERRIRVCAATNTEALLVAKALLDPDGLLRHWAVVDGFEIPPKATDPRDSGAEWAQYRARTQPPSVEVAP